jgi:aminomethyltransferase
MTLDLRSLRRDFGDVADEVRSCRTAAALFDFSFVARGRIEGPQAVSVLSRLTARPLADMRDDDIRYAVRTDVSGRLLSDLTIWRFSDGAWELMSGRREDVEELVSAGGHDLSAETAIFAVQGPAALTALDGIADTAKLATLRYFTHASAEVAGIACRVGRLGYTGEQGFEIVARRHDGARLWNALAERARPAGFAAADTLRIEAGFVLFANEFRLPVAAAEAGLARFAAAAASRERAELTLVCLAADSCDLKVPWQPSRPVVRPIASGAVAVTSNCKSSQIDGVLLLGFARTEDLERGAALHDQANEFTGLRQVALPIYDPGKQRPRQPMVLRPI